MAKGATQIFIATIERPVPFDIFTFYRGMHTNALMQAMHDGFEAGSLQPFQVTPDAVFGLDQALRVYKEVLGGAKRRIVFNP